MSEERDHRHKDRVFRFVSYWSLTVIAASMTFFLGFTMTAGVGASGSIGIYIIGADMVLAFFPFVFVYVWATG